MTHCACAHVDMFAFPFQIRDLSVLGTRRSRPAHMADGGERIVAKFHSVRHKKQDGVLLFTSGRVAWSCDDRVQANYPYPEIKGTSNLRLPSELGKESSCSFKHVRLPRYPLDPATALP